MENSFKLQYFWKIIRFFRDIGTFALKFYWKWYIVLEIIFWHFTCWATKKLSYTRFIFAHRTSHLLHMWFYLKGIIVNLLLKINKMVKSATILFRRHNCHFCPINITLLSWFILIHARLVICSHLDMIPIYTTQKILA